MNYTMNELNNILKTLPIGYYLKRNVSVEMDETSSVSYYDPMHDTICISFNQLSGALDSLKDNDKLEENVRTILYHEVSHAFITPKNMRATTTMNIFEDERIESVLRHYYMNTNFREFVKRVNNFKGEEPTNAESAFYHLIRYRIGDKKWLDELHELIKKYAHLSRNSKYWYDVNNYEHDVNDFHDRFVREWFDNHKDDEKEDEEKDENETSENNDSASQMNSNEENEENKENEEESNEESDEMMDVPANPGDDTEEYDEYNVSIAQESIEETLNEFNDNKLTEQIFQILSKIASTTKKNGSAINSYSGVFDPRSVARDDYRYFVQKNRLGHVKAYSKTKLNLFIDVSGSFYPSETIVNKLLYALSIFERQNPDFTFDVVKCQYGEKLCEKNDRQIKCGGGNLLDGKIFDIFNRLQDKNATVYNIVLFDGDAFSNASGSKLSYFKNFGAFNFKNTTIISDSDNRTAIERYCGNAKRIFTRNYADELIQNVLNTLQLIAR